jgi:hypothetical protein
MSQIASTVLMVRPASFGFNAETAQNNVFQKNIKASQKEIQQKAVGEFDKFVATLRKKGVEVIVFDDTAKPVKPDALFPNNWFCTLGDGTLAVFPMYAPNRRIEKRNDLLEMLVDKFNVRDVEDWSEYEAESLFLEGTGSMIIDQDYKVIYACISPRTNKSVLEKFAYAHGYKAMLFYSRDENGTDVYHTNVIMHLGETYAVICMESITNETERIAVSQLLISTGHEIIPISLKQVHAYAGNMLQVKNAKGEKFTILSKSAYNSLTKEQKDILQHHTTLLPMDIATIETIGGGSTRCMMAEIFLEKK